MKMVVKEWKSQSSGEQLYYVKLGSTCQFSNSQIAFYRIERNIDLKAVEEWAG
jgi:hypothetical protein